MLQGDDESNCKHKIAVSVGTQLVGWRRGLDRLPACLGAISEHHLPHFICWLPQNGHCEIISCSLKGKPPRKKLSEDSQAYRVHKPASIYKGYCRQAFAGREKLCAIHLQSCRFIFISASFSQGLTHTHVHLALSFSKPLSLSYQRLCSISSLVCSKAVETLQRWGWRVCIYVCVCLSVSETEKQREGVQGRNGGRSQQG